jgi:ABC-type sugar transport system ATPase subunit
MENEILGVVGHNASSKTTLIKAISGVMRIEKGSVKVRDRDGGLVEVNSVAGSRALGMTVLHEHVNLYDHFTVAENIYFGVYSKTYENGKRPVLPFIKWNRINECAQDLCNSLCFDIDVREKTEQFGTAENIFDTCAGAGYPHTFDRRRVLRAGAGGDREGNWDNKATQQIGCVYNMPISDDGIH